MKTEELMRMKSEFLDGFDASFREQTPPDIHLRPCYGPPLPAHKAVLVILSLSFSFSHLKKFLIDIFIASWQLQSLYEEQLSMKHNFITRADAT